MNPLKTVLFLVITQRVVVISYRCFGTTYRSQLQGSRIQKESRLSQYGVYVGHSVGSDKCQPTGLMLVVAREGKCGSQCNFEERCSVREEILRGNYLHESSGRKDGKECACFALNFSIYYHILY